MSSTKANNINKSNYRRTLFGGQSFIQSSSQDQKENQEIYQKCSQETIDSQRDGSIPIISFTEKQLVNPNKESVLVKEDQITTPKKNYINPSTFSEAINNQQQQLNNKPFLQKNLLSPTSSQSSGRSRSSLSSPVQIRINSNQFPQQFVPNRKSQNYEICQIQEKRLEDEKTAISYAEKVLMNRNFLSQQKSKQENQRYSLFLTTAQQAGVIIPKEGQQGILKKKVPYNNNLSINNQINNNNNSIQGNQNKSILSNPQQSCNDNTNQSNYSSNIISLNNNIVVYNQQILNDQIKLNNQFQSLSNVQQQQNYSSQKRSWSSQELPDDPQKSSNHIKISKFQLPDRSGINSKTRGSDLNQFATSNNKLNIINPVSLASSKVRGRRTLGQNQNIDLNNGKEVARLDRKTLEKITKKNTERNSIIQPERSMDDHCNKLARCNEHSKRIKELYCVDENCQIKQKFGCVLCFSSVNGSPHSFHEYYTISSEEDLQQKINRNREDFISFITNQIIQKGEAITVIRKYKNEITNSVINYATALQDRLFIGFEAEEIKKFQLPLLQGKQEDYSPNKKNKRYSRDKKDLYDEKELSIVLYLDLLEKQLEKKIENQTRIWLDQKYLGNKDEEFERQKRCKLIIISKCFSSLSEEQLQLFMNAGELTYNLQEYENSNPQLHYICDQQSDGIYQLDENKDKHGRGIQFLKGGTIYEGYFKKNQRYGMGKLITSQGDIYVGEFKKNCQKGQGVLKYANNDIYKGEFKSDQRHGQGTLYSASNQTIYVGGWARNQRQGKCQIYDQDNQLTFIGSYDNDQVKP